MKRILSGILVVSIILSIFAGLGFGAHAADLPSSGQCGDNVYYTFDSSTGKLTISGSGAMSNYNYSSTSPFYEQTAIKSIEIQSGVTSIGNEVFFGCSGLINITIGKSITDIGNSAFLGCSGLTSITIPDSVTSIHDFAFRSCKGLTSITIPASVTRFYSGNVFDACSGLTSIQVDANNTVYNSKNNCNAIIETETNTLIAGCQNTVIPNTVTSIGYSAFDSCSGLTNITIPNSVTSIGSYAFWKCSGLTSITIPASVTSIGEFAFSYCSGLTSIQVDANNTVYNSQNNCNAIIETETNTLIAGCQNTVIPGSVTSIGDFAFCGCSGLTSITIPNSVTSIGSRAFNYCSGLTSVTIPNSVTSIGDYAFLGCYSLQDVYYSSTQAQWGNVTIESGNEELTNATFYFAKSARDLAQGETFYMGRWPQSEVTDSSLLSALNAQSVTLHSYAYKHSTDATGACQVVDMQYGDVAYGGEVYRKVVLNSYRPFYTTSGSSTSPEGSCQGDNGYYLGIYWFRWDPIQWRTLKAEENGTYVMSDIVLDAQPYNDFDRATTWEKSTLRKWLAVEFYESAFSPFEKEELIADYHANENSPRSGSVGGGAATTDTVWLLSYADALNAAYGFASSESAADTARRADGSDYAMAQGLCVNTGAYWWLRTPGLYANSAVNVDNGGRTNADDWVHDSNRGVRPVIKLLPDCYISNAVEPMDVDRVARQQYTLSFNPNSGSCSTASKTVTVGDSYGVLPIPTTALQDTVFLGWFTEETGGRQVTAEEIVALNDNQNLFAHWHIHDYKASVTAPTCTAKGHTTYTCSGCGDTYIADETPATGHSYTETVITAPACARTGSSRYSCKNCGDTYTATVPALGHDWGYWQQTTAPTCTEKGQDTRICKRDASHKQTRDVNALGHNYVPVVTAPTCTAQGYTTYTCSRCQDAYVDNYTDALGHSPKAPVEENRVEPGCETTGSCDLVTYCSVCSAEVERVPQTLAALGHNWGEWQRTTNPTCTEKGQDTRICARNDSHKQTRDVSAIGHNYISAVTAPTCKAQGYTTHTCTNCGSSYQDSYTAVTSHSFDSGKVTEKASCTEEGTRLFTCSVCGENKTEIIPALGHNYTKTVTAPTCKAQGYTTHTCTNCGSSYQDSYTAVTSHSFGSGKVTKNASCTEQGTRLFTCSVCGENKTEIIPALGHNYTAVVTAPTCKAQGYTTHTCTNCGDSYQDSYTAVTSHSFGSGKVTKNASCTEEGTRLFTCSVCGENKTEIIPALGHNYTAVVTAPTCKAQGYTTHTCTNCGDQYRAQYTNKTAHSFNSGVVTKAATCSKAGEKTFTCTVCGTVQTQAIPATGSHTWNSGVVTKAATCSKAGEKTFTCTVCGIVQTQAIPATGSHTWNSGKVTKAATCSKAGEKTFTCTVCGIVQTQAIPATGAHAWNSGKVTKAATCTAYGVKTYTCSLCNTTKTESIAKAAHTYTNVITKATTAKNGLVVKRCSVCGEVKSKATVYYPKTITLSGTRYTYIAGIITPKVTVKDAAGKVIAAKYYTLTYAAGRMHVGRYAVKITFKGLYSGAVMRYFDIVPRPSAITKASKPAKAQFAIEWSKVSGISGYQIQRAQNKTFTAGLKTVNAKSTSTNALFKTDIKANTAYYVRIRTYKIVRYGGKNVVLYSNWSKVSGIKTR